MKQNKSAKRSLLFSVLSLLLCCTMLAGTTFAWFTDSVTSGNNKIVAGNLDVELYRSNQAVPEEKVTATTKLFVQPLWEPGVAVFENLKVANEGTLALKYQLMINFTNAVKTPAGKTLADVLKVGVVEGGVSGTRDAVIDSVTTWEPLATFVLEEALAATESDTYGIVIWWEPSDVDNEFNMNNENKNIVLTIDLGVSLIATQVDAESDAFGNDYDDSTTLPELIQDNAELKAALTADVEHIVVNLANDVTWDVAAWAKNAMGGASTKTITINAHGHTINFNQTDSDWNNITAGEGIVLTINNAKVTNSGHNNGPWNRHDLNFACEVVLNDVTSDKAMAFKNSATLNNVTIDDANTSDTYAIWVQPAVEGQTITLNNCVIDMLDCTDGRGIKIDNQYIEGVEKGEKLVTLNVSNTTFKTEEKSAILVKTTLGANITLNNVDIANTPDPVHAVWVDEDCKDYVNLVTVAGGEKYYEGDVASTSAGLNDLIANGETYIVLAPGRYSMPTTDSDVTIVGSRDTVITIDKPKANKVALQGVTVVGSGNYTGIQHSDTVVYENCLIKGVQFLYANKVVFNNCTFDLTEKADYIWTYGAKDVEFNNCTFNTAGKAILIYTETASHVTNVSVKGCTFNATASALAGGNVAAAIEIDSSLSKNGHYTLVTENNTVDSDFCGEWRIKKSGSNNTTVNGIVYNAVTIDGKVVAYTAADLQKVLDAATDGLTVYFANDIAGDVTVTQKPGVKVTIDGNGKNFAGVILVNGKSGTYTTAGLTIQNVNFVADSISADACIRLGDGTNATRYTCNVTVSGCTFDVPGAVAVKSYTGGDKNLVITGCTVNAGMHSALQVTNIEEGLKIVDCKIYSKNGINLNYTPSLEMSGCTINVQGYAVRFGVNGTTNNGTFSIANSTLTSANDDGDAVIILRGTMTGATLTLTNTTLTGAPEITGDANIVR